MKNGQGGARISHVREAAARVAREQGYELVEVTLQKEADGRALCIYIDTDGGITLSDCERFHKAVQPLLEDVDYDYLEVSSPGADRPIRTEQEAARHLGELVEVKLFAKEDGSKQFMGTLVMLNDAQVVIAPAPGQERTFPRAAVAMVKPVITVEEE